MIDPQSSHQKLSTLYLLLVLKAVMLFTHEFSSYFRLTGWIFQENILELKQSFQQDYQFSGRGDMVKIFCYNGKSR